MSPLSKVNNPPKEHTGSIQSYVIGFSLSLILTIIAYFMVRMQLLINQQLLLAILGLAVLQMFVQIFFFLHLGRGPKPFYNVIFFFGTAGMIVLVVGASLIIMDNLYRNMSPREVTTRLAQNENIDELNGKPTGACQGNKDNHLVTIGGATVKPQLIEAKRCDTLTFVSGDGQGYMLLFGPHEAPVSYGGLDAVSVRSDRSKIITLNEVGVFTYHDHANSNVTGTFSVRP